jgi:hypothetical protein
MQAVGKRRSALADISKAPKKHKHDFWTETLAIEESSAKMKMRLEKSQKAAAASHAKLAAWEAQQATRSSGAVEVEEPIMTLPTEIKKCPTELLEARRQTIRYFFDHVCRAPPESTWLQDGVISGIMHKMNLPAGSSDLVKKVCRDVLVSI